MTTPNQQPLKYDISDELKKKTGVYPIVDVKMVPVNLVTVPDIISGGSRKRKFGLALSITIMPDIDKEEEPIIMASDLPSLFFDGDSLDDLKERVHAELETIMEAAKDQIKNGNIQTTDTRDKAVH